MKVFNSKQHSPQFAPPPASNRKVNLLKVLGNRNFKVDSRLFHFPFLLVFWQTCFHVVGRRMYKK